MAKFIQLSLYDSEKYHSGKNPKTTKYINVDGKTEQEIKKEIATARLIQKEKNKIFKNKKGKGLISQEVEASEEIKESPKNQLSFSNDKLEIEFDNGTGNTFVLFGASKSGKTTLMMKIYNEYFPKFYPLKKTLTTLFAMNPQIGIYNSTQDDKLIIKCPYLNENSAEYIDWQRQLNIMNDNKYFFLNMFDDFIEIKNKSIVNNLLLTYRNSNMSSIICLQYSMLLSKSARSNINNIFLLHLNTDESIEAIIKTFLQGILKKMGIGNNMGERIQWYREMTDNHNYIYIHPLSGKVYITQIKKYINL